MLRTIALVLAFGCIAAGVIAEWRGIPMIPLAVLGALMVFGLLFERFVYKPIRTDAPGPGWDLTQETFQDPVSGQTVSVWYNRTTGERRYVASGRA